MRYTDLIFDVDGTLWDSTEVVAKAWNAAAFDTFGLTKHCTGAILKKEFGRTMDKIAADLFPELSAEDQHRMIGVCCEYEDRYLAQCSEDLSYAGVCETFAALSVCHRIFIASNCQKGYIELCMEKNRLTPYVSGHLCYGETGLPKWDTIRLLMKQHGIAPENALYIGDTIGDAEAALKAGIAFLHAEYGFGQVPEAVFKVSDIRALPEYPCIK